MYLFSAFSVYPAKHWHWLGDTQIPWSHPFGQIGSHDSADSFRAKPSLQTQVSGNEQWPLVQFVQFGTQLQKYAILQILYNRLTLQTIITRCDWFACIPLDIRTHPVPHSSRSNNPLGMPDCIFFHPHPIHSPECSCMFEEPHKIPLDRSLDRNALHTSLSKHSECSRRNILRPCGSGRLAPFRKRFFWPLCISGIENTDNDPCTKWRHREGLSAWFDRCIWWTLYCSF